MQSIRDLRTINALRQMLLGACLSGLFFGYLAEIEEKEKEQERIEEQVKEQKLFKDFNSGDSKTRALAEIGLLEEALENTFELQRAESIVNKILAKDPNSPEAHMVLSKIFLDNWWLIKRINPPNALENKRKGLKHLRQAKSLYKKKNMWSKAQKLEKAESAIQKGEGYSVWFNSFPKLGNSIKK